MFGFNGNDVINSSVNIYLIDYWYILLASIILSTPIVKGLKQLILKINKNALDNDIAYLMHGLSLGIYMFIIMVMLSSSTYNPFLYFRLGAGVLCPSYQVNLSNTYLSSVLRSVTYC